MIWKDVCMSTPFHLLLYDSEASRVGRVQAGSSTGQYRNQHKGCIGRIGRFVLRCI